MNPLRIKSLLIAMAALVAFASAIAAQVTGGAVTGTVLDPDGLLWSVPPFHLKTNRVD